MLRRFIGYYRPHKRILFLDLTASLLISVIGVFYPIVTRRMVTEFTSGGNNIPLLLWMGGLLLAVYLVRYGLDYFIHYYGHVMGCRMQASMRRDLFCHLQTLPFSFFDDRETGKIMSRLTNDLFEVSELAHHGPENLIISVLTIIISFIYLATINLWLTLIVFACVPLLFLIAWRLRRAMNEAFTASRAAVAEINASVESSISGIRVTKAYCNKDIEVEKFDRGNEEFVGARTRAYNALGRFFSSTTFVTNVFYVAVLICGGIFLFKNMISVADYSAFAVSVGLFITPVTTLINFMEMLEDGISGFKRFCEIMDEPSEKEGEGATPLENLRGDIRFENVSSRYGEGREILHGMTFNIEAGKTYAFVGPSGGGKTTVCHLLPHFYDISEGKITIDGRDIKGVTLESLRKNIGIVQQDVYLFNATFRDNILYGRPDATEAEVEEAARNAEIHDFIMSTEKGYDTVIGERGVKLSGGQKQRLSIARVFLKNPKILVLDEATSALDNATEIQIQSALDKLCRGRTTLVVAHRLSTVRGADTIAVVEQGRITEEGTHEELLERGGTYSELYKSNLR